VLKEDRDIAGIILEPTGASMGCYPIRDEFLLQLREVTEKYRVLLIFDEVVTGFRISPGGAQERFGVWPDLTALAKILGGGLPAGAVGGKREIIELIAFHEDMGWNTSERVSHPGTFNANPLSAAAGVRCLDMIASGGVNTRADEAASRLKSGFNRILRKEKVTGFAYGLASLVWVLLGVEWDEGGDIYTLTYEKIKEALFSDRAVRFKRAMLNAGVDIMGTAEFIVSTVHGEREVEDTLQAFERALLSMRSEGIL
jgi:glutamate-1-semialdehyde 2,1-aminomutase